MIFGFYFRFLKLTGLRWLSLLLARLAMIPYRLLYLCKKLLRRRESVSLSYEEALGLVSSAHPDPKGRPEYHNPPIDDTLDLSIVVPVYNHLDLLPRNLDSILNQRTSYRFELILVDDGSTEDVRGLLEHYGARENVQVIYQENRGIGGARNTGIDAARGKYLMFVDCDDEIHEDMVEELLACAYREGSDITMCAHSLIKTRDGVVQSVLPNIYPPVNLGGYQNGDQIMNYAGLPWGKLYRRELFDQVRFFPGYWYEDTIIQWLVFPQCQGFHYIDKVLYDYYWFEKNFSHTQGRAKNPKALDRYWLLLAIIERYEALGLPFDGRFYALLLRHISFFYYPDTSNLDVSLQKAMFVLARALWAKYRPSERVRLPFALREVEKAFRTGDFALWKLISVNQ